MAASFTINGNNVTITFAFTAPIAAAQDTVASAAKRLYLSSPAASELTPGVAFDQLTPQQQLNILDQAILASIIEGARYQYALDAANAARAIAEEEAKQKFI
jgi:hypothetical protein